MKMITRIKVLLEINKNKPSIIVTRWGSLTPNPQVTVSIASESGALSLFTFDDDEAGNAKAKHYAETLAHVTGLPLHMGDIKKGPSFGSYRKKGEENE